MNAELIIECTDCGAAWRRCDFDHCPGCTLARIETATEGIHDVSLVVVAARLKNVQAALDRLRGRV